MLCLLLLLVLSLLLSLFPVLSICASSSVSLPLVLLLMFVITTNWKTACATKVTVYLVPPMSPKLTPHDNRKKHKPLPGRMLFHTKKYHVTQGKCLVFFLFSLSSGNVCGNGALDAT